MNKIEDLYDEILTEMPHIDLSYTPIPKNTDSFDLEFENIKDKKMLARYFYRLFFQGKRSDSSGRSIYIKNRKHREILLNNLISNETVLFFITKVAHLENVENAEKWLKALIQQGERVNIAEAARGKYKGYALTIHRNQDESLVGTLKDVAISSEMAMRVFLKKLRNSYPEYMNDDLYHLKVTEIKPKAKKTYDPKQYWWNND